MEARDLLVISDLHLGEDLGLTERTTVRLERELVAFLDYHRTDGGAWRLVINGDMLELAGVVVPPQAAGLAPTDPHEPRYGLGSHADAAAVKMQAIADHHAPVFDALARFVGEGHQLSVVIGNHDAELHWPATQAVFRRAIARAWARQGGDAAAVTDSVQFHPWFFHAPGVAWIEHGHQYDPYCSFEHVLAPATDEGEIDPNVGYLIMRYVCSHFDRDLHHAQHRGFLSLIGIWLAQPPSSLWAILRGYTHMSVRLLQHWARRGRARVRVHRARARTRLAELAAGVDEALLTELSGLWSRPVVSHLGRLFRALMLDRLALVASALLFVVALLVAPASIWLPVLTVGASIVGLFAWHATQRREPMHPGRIMRERAHQVLSMMDVPFVVMGHSHQPIDDRGPHGAYLNSGTWAPHNEPSEAFTHVRIRHTRAGVRASLHRWAEGAPRLHEPELAAEPAPVVAPVPVAGI